MFTVWSAGSLAFGGPVCFLSWRLLAHNNGQSNETCDKKFHAFLIRFSFNLYSFSKPRDKVDSPHNSWKAVCAWVFTFSNHSDGEQEVKLNEVRAETSISANQVALTGYLLRSGNAKIPKLNKTGACFRAEGGIEFGSCEEFPTKKNWELQKWL